MEGSVDTQDIAGLDTTQIEGMQGGVRGQEKWVRTSQKTGAGDGIRDGQRTHIG